MTKRIWETIKQIFNAWIDDNSPKLAAALSFYTIFSMAPLLLIAISVASIVFGEDAAQGRIVYEIENFVGREGAILIQRAIANSSQDSTGIIATIIGLVTLLIGASAVFVELQDSLNHIWKVRQKPGRPIKSLIRNRLVSFILVVSMGALLFTSLLVSSILEIVIGFISTYLAIPAIIFRLVDIMVSFTVITLLFATIYKVLPDVYLSWKDVRMGAIVTSLLFILGKYLISLYLGTSSYASVFGAAGSLAIFILWIYYSSQVVFLGAEFTYVYAVKFGSGINPKMNAERINTNEIIH